MRWKRPWRDAEQELVCRLTLELEVCHGEGQGDRVSAEAESLRHPLQACPEGGGVVRVRVLTEDDGNLVYETASHMSYS